jgi:hypothetical protein
MRLRLGTRHGVEDTGNRLGHKILLCAVGRCADDRETERSDQVILATRSRTAARTMSLTDSPSIKGT